MEDPSTPATAALLRGLHLHPRDGFAVLRAVRDERGRVQRFEPELGGGGRWERVWSGPSADWLRRRCAEVLDGGRAWSGRLHVLDPEREPHERRWQVHVLPGDAERVVCHLQDAPADGPRQPSDQRAGHDPLTGLPARPLLLEHLQVALGRSRRSGRAVAVVSCDLDGFRAVVDTFGQAAGEEALVEVAARLTSALRPGDVVARSGEDEFVALLVDLPDEDSALAVAERVRASVGGHHRLAAGEVVLAASMGLSVTTSAAREAGQLLTEADTALLEARRRGRGQVQRYAPELHARASYRLSTEAELDRGLHRGELRLHYQPKYDLLSGAIAAVEVLVRWQHPTRGLLPPGQFLPIAEDSDLILGIGSWVLREACRVGAQWAELTDVAPEIDVNLAARQVHHPQLFEEVMGALAHAGVDPGRLELEVTETQVMTDLTRAADTLARLQGAGVKVALDDFGTGHSSLTWLQHLPADTLKLDRSFVHRIGDDPQSLEIVRAVIDLSHALDLRVVAEGIETDAQRHLLVGLGADLGQGFHLARPMDEEQLAVALTTTRTTLPGRSSAGR